MNKKEIDKILQSSNESLGNKTDKQILQYVSEGHKKQNKERASKGGTKAMPKGVYGKVQKIGNDAAFKMKVGIHNKSNPNYKNWKSDAGSQGAKSQMKNGIGIHNPDKALEYKRLGGLSQVKNLNIEKTCPHCGVISKGAGYNRWHGDNCKHK
jgi:hypothetical protein